MCHRVIDKSLSLARQSKHFLPCKTYPDRRIYSMDLLRVRVAIIVINTSAHTNRAVILVRATRAIATNGFSLHAFIHIDIELTQL